MIDNIPKQDAEYDCSVFVCQCALDFIEKKPSTHLSSNSLNVHYQTIAKCDADDITKYLHPTSENRFSFSTPDSIDITIAYDKMTETSPGINGIPFSFLKNLIKKVKNRKIVSSNISFYFILFIILFVFITQMTLCSLLTT
jgi:hypothetical protein